MKDTREWLYTYEAGNARKLPHGKLIEAPNLRQVRLRARKEAEAATPEGEPAVAYIFFTEDKKVFAREVEYLPCKGARGKRGKWQPGTFDMVKKITVFSSDYTED